MDLCRFLASSSAEAAKLWASSSSASAAAASQKAKADAEWAASSSAEAAAASSKAAEAEAAAASSKAAADAAWASSSSKAAAQPGKLLIHFLFFIFESMLTKCLILVQLPLRLLTTVEDMFTLEELQLSSTKTVSLGMSSLLRLYILGPLSSRRSFTDHDFVFCMK